MRQIRPLRLVALGFALLLFGFLAIFLMVIRLIEPSFTLNFLAYISSVVGLVLGLIGAASHTHSRRQRRD